MQKHLSETAAYLVAKRKLKAVKHLQDKMRVALQVIVTPPQEDRCWAGLRKRYDQPDILYLLQVMEKVPALFDRWMVERIASLHGKHHERARMLLDRHKI
ncbi:hypothetical protein [Deinococcus roseus]|uniref:Transposase n=1 Tax=Deinococcus roseus TaxID=392414 RepID=A0ABQ2CZS9_9DEIO|nr:hypothetical protein [Deinococcus roseus]GGJ36912.1 hypothetical protein GCM10008938_23690 [Deinococcus roseus]